MLPANNDPNHRFRHVIATLGALARLVTALTSAAVTGHALGFW
jgi:hypothetical protein